MSDTRECTCHPDDWVDTDNTAVIRALEKRVGELEAVAEAAVALINLYSANGSVAIAGGLRIALFEALRAAGYLGGGEK